MVAIGNVLRITASVGMGLVAGRASLVLFHDWVGSLFAFAYILGGYILMISLLLPRPAAVLLPEVVGPDARCPA